MQLIFLGSGSAFTVGCNNYHSNVLLTLDQGQRLLLDCGSDIRFSLHAMGMSYLDITDIYISHLHSDHAGGLEYIGLNSFFNPNCPKPNLYIHESIAASLWNNTLSGGMYYIEEEVTTLETFFNVHVLSTSQPFLWQGLSFELIPVVHVKSKKGLMPTFGLFFELAGTQILFTADTQLCLDILQSYYQRADLIFQDCETSRFPSPVHAHYQQLRLLPSDIKSKMWLYGYQPGPLPTAETDGFAGFIQCQQQFQFPLVPVSAPKY